MVNEEATATKATHTPGPWRVGRHANGRLTIETDASIIAALYGPTEPKDGSAGAGVPDYLTEKYKAERAVVEANAAVLTAAPDLLHAAETLYGMIDAGVIVRNIGADETFGGFVASVKIVVGALQQLAEAIVKAKGEPPIARSGAS